MEHRNPDLMEHLFALAANHAIARPDPDPIEATATADDVCAATENVDDVAPAASAHPVPSASAVNPVSVGRPVDGAEAQRTQAGRVTR